MVCDWVGGPVLQWVAEIVREGIVRAALRGVAWMLQGSGGWVAGWGLILGTGLVVALGLLVPMRVVRGRWSCRCWTRHGGNGPLAQACLPQEGIVGPLPVVQVHGSRACGCR